MATGELSSEERLKAAARKVFLKKGYEGATSREIAKEAGINHAMMNYYFRSKEKLFNEVYLESFLALNRQTYQILSDEVPLEVKVYTFVDRMTDFLLADPDLPMFVISELHKRPDSLSEKMGSYGFTVPPVLTRQLEQGIQKGVYRETDPLHFTINLVALTLFPFITWMSMSRTVTKHGQPGFEEFVLARKKLVPQVVLAALKKDD